MTGILDDIDDDDIDTADLDITDLRESDSTDPRLGGLHLD